MQCALVCKKIINTMVEFKECLNKCQIQRICALQYLHLIPYIFWLDQLSMLRYHIFN